MLIPNNVDVTETRAKGEAINSCAEMAWYSPKNIFRWKGKHGSISKVEINARNFEARAAKKIVASIQVVGKGFRNRNKRSKVASLLPEYVTYNVVSRLYKIGLRGS